MKNKILEDKILSSILSNTISGNLQWFLVKNIFNSEKSYKYQCDLGNDSNVSLTVTLDENLLFSGCSILTISNPKLTGGQEYCHKWDNEKVNTIANQVFLKYVKPILTPKSFSQESIMEEILNSISIEENRDRKIDEIITKKKKWSLF